MKKSIADQMIAQITQDIEEWTGNIEQNIAKRFADEFPAVMANVMQGWYNDYDPVKYIRTWDLYAGTLAGTEVQAKGNTIQLHVDSDQVGQHSHDSGEYVWSQAFLYGIHGVSRVAVSTPSPSDLLEERSNILLQQIAEDELTKALRQGIDKYKRYS